MSHFCNAQTRNTTAHNPPIKPQYVCFVLIKHKKIHHVNYELLEVLVDGFCYLMTEPG